MVKKSLTDKISQEEKKHRISSAELSDFVSQLKVLSGC